MRVMVDLTSMKILRWREVNPIVGCSRMTIARMEKTGAFPQRIRIGNGSVGWLKHEVEDWLTQRMAVRVEDECKTISEDHL
jgi:prophage regulatory protein